MIRISMLSLTLAASLLGSEPEEAPSPTAPYLARAPEHSAWRLKPETPPKADAHPPALVERDVIKAGALRKEVTVLSDQTVKTAWFIGRAKYEKITPEGWTKLDGRSIPGVQNFAESDFPELNIVKIENYRGLEKKAGYLCYAYATSIPSEAVWIDVKTHWPIAWEGPLGVLYYEFLAAPTEKLAVPREIAILDGSRTGAQ